MCRRAWETAQALLRRGVGDPGQLQVRGALEALHGRDRGRPVLAVDGDADARGLQLALQLLDGGAVCARAKRARSGSGDGRDGDDGQG